MAHRNSPMLFRVVPLEQKPIKFCENSRGRTQGFPKIFRAPIYEGALRGIFAITQLSCTNTKAVMCSVCCCRGCSFQQFRNSRPTRRWDITQTAWLRRSPFLVVNRLHFLISVRLLLLILVF